MNTKTTAYICSCRFTVKALGDFIDTFGRAPKCNDSNDCLWVGQQIDKAREWKWGTPCGQALMGREAVINYWKCRKEGIIVPLGGNKVGLLPLPETKAEAWTNRILNK